MNSGYASNIFTEKDSISKNFSDVFGRKFGHIEASPDNVIILIIEYLGPFIINTGGRGAGVVRIWKKQ